jgi:hypothetical protein
MLPEKVKVTVLADGIRYEGKPLNIGDRIEIADHLVADWVRAGIAREGWEIPKPPRAEPKVAKA